MTFKRLKSTSSDKTKESKEEDKHATTEDVTSSFSNPMFGKEPPMTEPTEQQDQDNNAGKSETAANNEVENPLFEFEQNLPQVEAAAKVEEREEEVPNESLGETPCIF